MKEGGGHQQIEAFEGMNQEHEEFAGKGVK